MKHTVEYSKGWIARHCETHEAWGIMARSFLEDISASSRVCGDGRIRVYSSGGGGTTRRELGILLLKGRDVMV